MAVTISGTSGLTFPDSTIQSSSGTTTTGALRAWVNFNGTGTVAIRASGNVSSITDNGTGDYTVNFTTAMPDANYSTTGMTSTDNVTQTTMAIQGTNTAQTTAGVRLFITGGVSASADRTLINVAIFR